MCVTTKYGNGVSSLSHWNMSIATVWRPSKVFCTENHFQEAFHGINGSLPEFEGLNDWLTKINC